MERRFPAPPEPWYCSGDGAHHCRNKMALEAKPCVRRRTVMQCCIGVSFCLVNPYIARVAVASAGPRNYKPLKVPVIVPLKSVAEVWNPVLFRARLTLRDGRDSIIPGMALRLPAEKGVHAFCLYCPHELCIIDLTDSKELLCTCHSSTFDPLNRGAWIMGPAERGTYQFDCDITADNLRITGIESEIEERLL